MCIMKNIKIIIIFIFLMTLFPFFSEASNCSSLEKNANELKEKYYKIQTELADLNIKLNEDLKKEQQKNKGWSVVGGYENWIWEKYNRNFQEKKALSDSIALKHEIAVNKYNDCAEKKYRFLWKFRRRICL